MLLDLSADPVTGLRREPALTPPGNRRGLESRMTNRREECRKSQRTPAARVRAPEFATLSLTEIVQGVRDRSLTPVELVTAALESIEQWQPVTNAASRWWPDEALAAARALPDDPQLALRGVPVLVKEQMDVAGHHSTSLQRSFPEPSCHQRQPARDAAESRGGTHRRQGEHARARRERDQPCVRLRTYPQPVGPATTDRRIERRVGGGGRHSQRSADARHRYRRVDPHPLVAVGVTGLKPTHDRLSMDGVMPLAPSFGCPGPIAAAAEDLGLACAVLADQPEALGRIA